MEFSFYFFAVCAIFVLTDAEDFLITIILSMLHEFGHIFAILTLKKKISEIKINAFSVDIVQNNFQYLPYSKELFILFSGPVVNIVFSSLAGIVYVLTSMEIFEVFAIQSFLIGIVNLFPIFSLDGGKIFLIFLRNFFSDIKSEKILFLVSILFIIPMMSFGFYTFLRSFNFSILVLSIYLSSFLIIREPKFFTRK